MLGEPAPSQADLNFVLFGIPVRVHPYFWLVTLFLGYRLGDAISVLIWVAVVFVSVLVHEVGHALAMERYGFRPWIVLYGLGGLTCRDQRYGFHSSRYESSGEILISLAGPAVGFGLAALLVLILMATGHRHALDFVRLWGLMPTVTLDNLRLQQVCNAFFYVSILWGLVNLLPVYPLDGGQVAREILLALNPRGGIRQSLWLSFFVAAGMAIYGITQWRSAYAAIFFGYLAYSSYQTLQIYSSRGRWY
ncbi:MAG: site-2 protease family protein [Planctomycetaceae bacterium]|nr:site-2 protease family protein [Planctomycetaceae bacterium]